MTPTAAALKEVAAVTPRPTPAKADDRRRSKRMPHEMSAWICSPTAVNPKEERQEVRSLDLSRHGVRFMLDHELATGTYHVIEIGVGEQRLSSEVRIVSCCKGVGGRYEVGAEFC